MNFVAVSDRDSSLLSLLVYLKQAFITEMAAITMPSFGGDDLYLYMREIVEEEFPKALRQAGKPWHVLSGNRKADERLVASAIDKLRGLKEQYVNIEGSTSPQLLRQQLAQARGAFMALGVTLNDSRNAIDFSAAGLQELIPSKYLYYAVLSLNCYSACMNINFIMEQT